MSLKISFLVPDIGAPSIGAALKLARHLEPEYETEIVGPDFGRGVCSLYRGAYPFKAVPAGRLYRLPDYWWERNRLRDALSGDVVIAVKAFASTVPVALSYRKKAGAPVAVYLDEWDGALWHGLTPREKAACWLRHAHHPMEPCYHGHVERMIPKADTVLSTTTWLQRRFGGHVVHAGVDCAFFRPQPPDDVATLKRELGLEGRRVIVFGGVVRPHKGVEEILEALVRLGRDDIRLLVVGPLTDHLESLMRDPRLARFIAVAGAPMNDPSGLNSRISREMPRYLDVGDLVVLPLRDTLLAQSQMPIKIFEALAMGKPVIGTAVADLPLMLKGCGWTVPPGDSVALAAAIGHAFDHPDEYRDKGRAARARCESEFDSRVCGSVLRDMIGGLLHD